jgi:hypothetical protein
MSEHLNALVDETLTRVLDCAGTFEERVNPEQLESDAALLRAVLLDRRAEPRCLDGGGEPHHYRDAFCGISHPTAGGSGANITIGQTPEPTQEPGRYANLEWRPAFWRQVEFAWCEPDQVFLARWISARGCGLKGEGTDVASTVSDLMDATALYLRVMGSPPVLAQEPVAWLTVQDGMYYWKKGTAITNGEYLVFRESSPPVLAQDEAAATANLKMILANLENLCAEDAFEAGWNEALDAVLRAWEEDR